MHPVLRKSRTKRLRSRFASNVTVFDDQVADAVFGNDGQDWFFLTGFMGVYDPNLAEHGDHGLPAEDDSHGHSHPGAVILEPRRSSKVLR